MSAECRSEVPKTTAHFHWDGKMVLAHPWNEALPSSRFVDRYSSTESNGEVLPLKIVAARHKDVFRIHINGRIANRRSHV
jgi:hypothetical protein